MKIKQLKPSLVFLDLNPFHKGNIKIHKNLSHKEIGNKIIITDVM